MPSFPLACSPRLTRASRTSRTSSTSRASFGKSAKVLAGCLALHGAAMAQSAALATEPADPRLAPIEVKSSRNSVLGEAATANEGVVTQQQLGSLCITPISDKFALVTC